MKNPAVYIIGGFFLLIVVVVVIAFALSSNTSSNNPIHTHDDTGIIHIESPVKRDFTLADFFAVWNKPFSKDQIQLRM